MTSLTIYLCLQYTIEITNYHPQNRLKVHDSKYHGEGLICIFANISENI